MSKTTPGLLEQWERDLRVHLYFVRAVWPQFRLSLGLFLVVNLVGGLVLWTESAEPVSFPRAVYASLALILFEVVEPYPEQGGLLIQAAYFMIPAIGLTVIAEGLLRFGVVVFNRKKLAEEWHMALAESFKDHVVVAGLGKIGESVVRRLLLKERKLVCIEPRREAIDRVSLPPEVATLRGDATRPEMLNKANLAQARAILVLTNNDLANLEIGINAREINPKIKVVLRMFNENLGRQMSEQLGFQAIYSTSALAAPSFASAIYSSRILQTIDLGEDRVVHLAKFEVGTSSSLQGKTIGELERATGVSVVLHHAHEGANLLPDVEAHVSAKDQVWILAELEQLKAFESSVT